MTFSKVFGVLLKINLTVTSTLYYYWKKGLIQYKSLRKPHKKRRNKEVWFKHTNKTSIECRPDIVKEKTEYGHYEIDMVMDGERKGGLVTLMR